MESSPPPSLNKAIPEKTNQLSITIPPLKCPRCGSSNTKFCYYNNYSLSQPRHFCRACKRYWTRGGTLRNVPVGGGCRKDKRGKRRRSADHCAAPATATAAPVTSSAATNPSTWQQHLDLPPAAASSYGDSHLFYNLPITDPMDLNFQISRLMNSARVCSDQMMSGRSGLGFSPFTPQIQDAIATPTPPFFPISADGNTNNLLVGSTSLAAASSTLTMAASLLASGFQEQKFCTNGLKNVQPAAAGKSFTLTTGLMPNRQISAGWNEAAAGKEATRMDAGWNAIEPAVISSSDHSSVPWNSSNLGTWIDPSTLGLASSVVP